MNTQRLSIHLKNLPTSDPKKVIVGDLVVCPWWISNEPALMRVSNLSGGIAGPFISSYRDGQIFHSIGVGNFGISSSRVFESAQFWNLTNLAKEGLLPQEMVECLIPLIQELDEM